MAYTIKQVENLTGVSAHTLRYWAKRGLFSHIERDDKGYRYFSQLDLQWVNLVQCMRQTGMSIARVLDYVELCKRGESTMFARAEMMKAQESEIRATLLTYARALKLVRQKIKMLEGKLSPSECQKLRDSRPKRYKSLGDNAGAKKRL